MYRSVIVLAFALGIFSNFGGRSPSGLRTACAQESAPSSDAKAIALKAFQRGTAHYQQQEYDKAIAEFESGYQAVPQAVFLYNIAQSHRLAGRADYALTYYRQYLQLSPEAKNRPEIEERIAALEKQLGPPPKLIVPSAWPVQEPPPEGMLTPAQEKTQADKTQAQKRRRNIGIALGVVGGLLVVGAAVGLGLYFGLPQPPQVTVFQPVNQ
ncbi:MAG TPA: tetratricopeptide repeat protein [Pseudomonadota bacterium]|nr:tetratricopeptide repeat protein [Pseudomonadota bacterium]